MAVPERSADRAEAADPPPALRAGAKPQKGSLRAWRYRASQSARILWFAGQNALLRRLYDERSPAARLTPERLRERWKAFWGAFEADLEAIEAGLYPAPRDWTPGRWPRALARARAAMLDARAVDRRRRAGGAFEVRDHPEAAQFPPYYRQNFHFQTDGWLSAESAALYDWQVEILFAGAGDSMRRGALEALALSLRGRDQRKVAMLDIGCGSGRFLRDVMRAFPRLRASGLDLSPAYLAEARKRLRAWPGLRFAQGAAEALPFADASFDRVTAIYLFHELPPKIRRAAFAEIARVLKPRGRFILADSVQGHDGGEARAEHAPMLDYFERHFHEPYFATYRREDFPALAARFGFRVEADRARWLTRIWTFQKAAAGSGADCARIAAT